MNKRFLMKMLTIISACMLFIACNSSSTSESSKKDSTPPSTTVGTWTQEDELEFIDGCVENAKVRFGEAEAFSYCRCIFNKNLLFIRKFTVQMQLEYQGAANYYTASPVARS